ncbi:MAG: glycosyltransferase family 2 protein [Eubacterium sp.]
MKILMIIPCYNEEQNIKMVVEDIKENFEEADILLINDCSTDQTLEIIKSLENVVDYINLPINLGYSYAIQTGFKYAVQENYDYLLQFDGDGQHLASEAKKIFELACKTDVDIVIGSRFLSKTDYNHSFFRKIGTKIFQKSIKILAGETIYDPTSGLQVLDKKVFTQLSKIYAYPEFPDANLLIELIYQGYSINEIAVQMKEREFGESMHGGIIKPIKYMFKMTYYSDVIFFNNLTGRRKVKK